MIVKELTDIFDKYRSDKDIFHDLMPVKIQEVLLVATLYDAFILERDGQLSEQIFGEYYQLNLSAAPRITSAYSPEDALKKLDQRPFDVVILMVGLDVRAPLALAKEIKKRRELPVILLFNNSANLHLCPVDSPEMRHIDRVFVWNGYSKIFLAITKYIEDRANVDNDTGLGMVQVVLLIEDSIRFYSRYLPFLYAEIMRQTQRLIADENLDEMNKLLRMRARPKVLLATTYEEALELYRKYRKHLLAVISDVRFPRAGKIDPQAGLTFVRSIKEELPDLPVLMQSSEAHNEPKAHLLGAGFINKNSESLSFDIRNFLMDRLGFGGFVFRDLEGREIGRATNMEEFEANIRTIPQESLIYHASRNHFSAWLTARGELIFSRILRSAHVGDFTGPEELRKFIVSIFENVRNKKVKGRVINFDESVFGSSSYIVRFANGSLGGKGRGIAFINNLVENIDFSRHIPEMHVRIPTTAVIGIDEYDNMIDSHNLRDAIYREEDHERVKDLFLNTALSLDLRKKLKKFLTLVTCPLAVRSSGLFEDMLLQPFAGIYSTYLIPNDHPDINVRFKQLMEAIKLVYASIFSPKSRAYFDAVNYKIEEERMAIIIQEVIGRRRGQYHYPHISGTAQSFNYYPVADLKPEDGLATAALGLGSYVVEGEQAFRFSPRYPKRDLVSPDYQAQMSQRFFYALDLERTEPDLRSGEESCYARLDIGEAEKHGVLHHLASVYDLENHRIQPGLSARGPRILNFANILKYDHLPLARTLEILLEVGEKSLGNPVEIEYAIDLDTDRTGKPTFYLLQLKPLIQKFEDVSIRPEELARDSLALHTDRAMGNGRDDTVYDLIFVDPDRFNSGETVEMAAELEELNAALKAEGRKCILIGFGRWGTRDRWLGIPVQFNQISQARAMVEAGLENFQVDSSLGSHFFHNITSMNIGYFTIDWRNKEHFIDWDWLRSLTPHRTTPHLRHIRSDKPFEILMDGRKGISVIRKPRD
ncbi:MAG TPA: PEP/pyruvate-binding domain-containing protein [bacterium]|nr:PEP/pyruvate-binding domain-containing protein [bacterium]